MAARKTDKATLLVESLAEGRERTEDRFIETAFGDLRRIAGFLMAGQPPGHTLQATALVNEAYLKLVGGEKVSWVDRRHFINTVARAMRQLLTDRGRRYATAKHGGERERVKLRSLDVESVEAFPPEHRRKLEDAVRALEDSNPRWGEIVHLRFFAGLTIEQTAEVMGISTALVKRDWKFARAWLASALGGAAADD